MGGASYREGHVEVCVGGRWGTVCGEGWTNEDAGHVCTYLGYPREGKSLTLQLVIINNTHSEATKRSSGEGTGPVYSVECQQPHNSIDEYVPTVMTESQCTDHSQDVGVKCKSYNEVYEGNKECENEALSSLTTAMPYDSPTTSFTDNISMETLNNNSTTDTLGALLGLLGVTLAAVLAGWIMTCVYCHHKINK